MSKLTTPHLHIYCDHGRRQHWQFGSMDGAGQVSNPKLLSDHSGGSKYQFLCKRCGGGWKYKPDRLVPLIARLIAAGMVEISVQNINKALKR